MSPVDRDVVRRKLARIVQALDRMRREKDLSLETYLGQPDLQAVLERQLELVVGAAVELNVHLLVQHGHATPPDAYTSFLEVARLVGAIDGELAAQLAPSTGLRNRLAHAYDEIDRHWSTRASSPRCSSTRATWAPSRRTCSGWRQVRAEVGLGFRAGADGDARSATPPRSQQAHRMR